MPQEPLQDRPVAAFYVCAGKEECQMARKKKTNQALAKITYQSKAEARTQAGGIPVFCAFDKLVDPKDLVGNPRNPNQHPKEQIELLAHIIRSQGWRAPITVSSQSGYVVRGHGRLAAALHFGAETVPVDYQNYSNEAEEWADLIADNRLAELSELDDAKIADLIEEMDTGEVPVILSGYSGDEIENLLAAIAGDGGSEADGMDDEMPPPEIPMSRPGDLWLLGNHRLICGSAADRETVERLMNGEKAYCVFTDPPYGVSYVSQSGKFEMLQNDDLTDDELVQKLILPALRNCVEFTVEDAAFYIWHSSGTRQDFYYAMTAAGLTERQTIIWSKNGIVLGHSHYQWAHEPCFYCGKGDTVPRFFGDRAQHTMWRVTRRTSGMMETVISGGITITDGEGSKIHIAGKPPKGGKSRCLRVDKDKGVYLYNEGKTATLWEVSREAGAEHPTQKPVELATRAIENSTQEGEIILDLFGGSGTTLIGAELTNRTAYLAELDPKYVDVIVNRYARITGSVAGVCVRNGREIPYALLKRENDAANGRESGLR